MPKRIDIKDKTFGEWKVLEYIGKGYWKCECSCGVVRDILGKTLINHKSTSCGHSSNKLLDLTGQQINEWHIDKYIGNASWLCTCSCGEQRIISGYDLRHSKSKDCGHRRKEKLIERNKAAREKLEGTTINDWYVIEYIGNKHYRCRCSCGKIKDVNSNDLKSGVSKSCGHNNGKQLIKNIKDTYFGHLKVVEYAGNKKWKCICECGNYTTVSTGNLKNHSVQSCGCKQYNRLSEEDLVSAVETFIASNGYKPFLQDLSNILGRHPGNIQKYMHRLELECLLNKTYSSLAERDIHERYGGILHDRSILENKELDLYYPDKNIAIEYNGTYWHSSIYKDSIYHQEKTIECAKKGIRLIHIFEYEWRDECKKSKILNILDNVLLENSRTRIYARNTTITFINNQESNEFLDKHHLQGGINSEIRLGCWFSGELIGVMTFGAPRFNKNYQYEIIRMAWKTGIAVVGGTEKLFGKFLREYNPESIVTYCDIAKFTGESYIKLGFKADKSCITKPSYVWVNQTNNVLQRYQTNKGLLVKNGLGNFGNTEDEIMTALNFYKVYNCGNIRLVWNKDTII